MLMDTLLARPNIIAVGCAAAIFSSALLLFAIEPISGKYLLPYFGGSSSVWATSLVFFTGVLFLGYLYVYLLCMLPRVYQFAIHACLIAVSACIVIISVRAGGISSLSLNSMVGSEYAPYLNVLRALAVTVGMPFFLLSTTGPLFQYWFGLSAHREPYRLYALSNAGSLLALVAYPTLIEPFSAVHVQENWWNVSFLFCALIFCVVMAILFRSEEAKEVRPPNAHILPIHTMLLCVGFAALPAFMLVATTTQITQAVAPVPLLWVVPLILYLLTFVFAFSGRGGGILTRGLLLASVIVASVLILQPLNILLVGISYLTLLFLCGLVCHSEIWRRRPPTAALPLYYLLLSFGGMLGTFCASIIAPLVFHHLWEFPLGIAACALVALVLVPGRFFPPAWSAQQFPAAKIIFSLLVIAAFFDAIQTHDAHLIVAVRDFYGTAQVSIVDDFTVMELAGILHGSEYNEPEKHLLPTAYFTPGSGVGRSIAYEEGAQPHLRVGVLGLGVGTLASYCRPGDSYVFYELDPKIVSLAENYFGYLQHCKGAQVRVGDGRLLLQDEQNDTDLGRYDVLAIDAFTGDTVPVHLLTREALALYAAHLHSPESIIAFDVSNRYLDLAPVVLRLAQDGGFSAIIVDQGSEKDPGSLDSEWILLAKDPKVFDSKIFADPSSAPLPAPGPLWTDDYTSLFPLLKLPAF